MAQVVLISIVVVWVYMTLGWVIADVRKRNDLADIMWGGGFIAVATALLLQSGDFNTKFLIAYALVAIWGARLAVHIFLRHRGKPEDGRYVAMKSSWKYPRLQSYTNVFLSQGFFMLLVAVPIILLYSGPAQTNWWLNALGLIIWVVGFSFEAIGDYQLKRFISNSNNKGKIMRYGLWSYTRHPNYFGEITLWWGFLLFVLPTTYWYISFIGPLTITFLILGVSGIPMLEKRYIGNKEYDNYKQATSAFFPLPKKRP